MVGKEFPVFLSHLKRRRSPQERREELQGRATIPRVSQMSKSIPGKSVFPDCRDFQAEDRLTPRWHVGQPCGKTSWEILVGKPRGKASRESHRSLDPGEGKRDTAAAAQEESTRACPHSRRGLTPLGRLQKYPKIHVSTERNPQVPAPTSHKAPASTGEESREAPEQLPWGLSFPEATRAGP